MQFAKITSGKVEKILAGSKLPDGHTVIPNEHQLQVGDNVKFFTKDYKRMSAEEAEAAGLITVGENQKAQWEDGEYLVKADYRNADYWKKETGEKVEFRLDDEPDDTMTDIEPTDRDAQWIEEESRWEIPQEVKEQRIRDERDNLLKETDYIMMPDYPLSDKSEWQTYRQALRDITDQSGFPDNVTWPVKPKVK